MKPAVHLAVEKFCFDPAEMLIKQWFVHVDCPPDIASVRSCVVHRGDFNSAIVNSCARFAGSCCVSCQFWRSLRWLFFGEWLADGSVLACDCFWREQILTFIYFICLLIHLLRGLFTIFLRRLVFHRDLKFMSFVEFQHDNNSTPEGCCSRWPRHFCQEFVLADWTINAQKSHRISIDCACDIHKKAWQILCLFDRHPRRFNAERRGSRPFSMTLLVHINSEPRSSTNSLLVVLPEPEAQLSLGLAVTAFKLRAPNDPMLALW